MELKFLTLSEGLPSTELNNNEPDDETFLRTLFRNICNVDVSQCEILNEEKDGTTVLNITGRCGTPNIGYSFKRTKYIDDSSEDIMLINTYGLPNIQLRWTYSLWKSGYTYRFHHRRLEVAFTDTKGKELFEESWFQTFGLHPRFQGD